MNNVYPNPFAYGEIEQRYCKTFFEQREASYLEPMEPVFQGNGKLSFFDNFEAPTPQLGLVDGYKSAAEVSGGDACDGGETDTTVEDDTEKNFE